MEYETIPLYVQIEIVDGVKLRKHCWDNMPECGVGVDGWVHATEYKPIINLRRQRYTDHMFDFSVEPVVVRWGVVNYSVEKRIEDLIDQADIPFSFLLSQMAKKIIPYDHDLLMETKDTENQILACLKVATTHNQLDAIADKLVSTPEEVLAITDPDPVLEEIFVEKILGAFIGNYC